MAVSGWLAPSPCQGAARGGMHATAWMVPHGQQRFLPSCSMNIQLLHREEEIQAPSTHGIGGNVLQLFSLEISICIVVMSGPTSRLPT